MADSRVRKENILREIDSLDKLDLEGILSAVVCSRRQKLRLDLDEILVMEKSTNLVGDKK